MYTEFIIIFALLGVLIVLMLASVIMLAKLNKKVDSLANTRAYAPAQVGGTHNIVFCKNCATEYDAMQKRCPNCGTPR